LFRFLHNLITKKPFFAIFFLLAWLFLPFPFTSYHKTMEAMEQKMVLKNSIVDLNIQKQELILLREYLNTEAYIYDAAIKLGYSFENEQVIDIDFPKQQNMNNADPSNWWRREFRN